MVHGAQMADLLGTRLVEVPAALVRTGLAATFGSHLQPTEAALFELAMGLPELSVGRARDVLGWEPARTALEAVGDALAGMADGAGGRTAPLDRTTVRGRLAEVAGSIGSRP